MITDEQLAALDQAERAATPGKWGFIALSRNHLRELLGEVRLYRTQEAKSWLEHAQEIQKLRAELVAAREGLALMAEGEGDDPKVYQEMALYYMKRIDDTLGDG